MEPIKCLAVKQALKIYSEGGMSPCCMISKPNDEFTFADADSVLSYQNSEWVKNLHSDLSSGIKPKECSACFDREPIRSNSYRLYVNETLNYRETDNIEFLDLTLGNTCNSDCAMCKARSSSKIESRIDQDRLLPIFPKNLIKDFGKIKASEKWYNRPEFFEWYKTQASNLKIIKFRGGEPFLVRKLEEWLDYLIDNGYAKNITLQFNTNASILDQDLIFKCVKNFKYTLIANSIDGTGECYNYIRHGLNWSDIEKNLFEFQKYAQAFKNKFWTNICCVVQAYNLKYLIGLIDWCELHKFPLEWIFLVKPEYLEVKNIKDKIHIQQVIEQLKLKKSFQQDVIDELINYLNNCLETTSYPVENFVSYTNYMNSFRTLQFNTETLEIQ
jgi:organic radical activating enzyme